MNKDIIASSIFATGCFLFFVLVVPQYQGIADVKSVIGERQDLLIQRTAWEENVKTLSIQYQSRLADIERIGLLLPENKQIDQILVNIEALAQESGLQIKDLNISGSTNSGAGPYGITFIQISLAGAYSSLTNFLTEAEKNLRLYDIFEINIGRDTNSTGDNLVFSFKINSYNIK